MTQRRPDTGRTTIPAAGTAADRSTQPAGNGTAHGKVILLGEHAVVYGAPALALPIPELGCRARVVRQARSEPEAVSYRFLQTPAGIPSGPFPSPATSPQETAPEGIHDLIRAVLREAFGGGAPGVDVTLESGVPPARGLGSSAACARALTHALAGFAGLRLSADEVFRYVQVSENAAHGRASGIDALATGSRRPVLLDRGRATTPPVGADGWVVVADSGSGASTKDAVTMLSDGFAQAAGSRERFLERSATLTREGLRHLERGDLAALGGVFTACHELLAGLGLTTARTDALARAALEAGALGAKMSGGGLGGCVIALTATGQAAGAVAALLLREQGALCWVTPLTRGEGHDGI
ncbi:mevalonate kinase [Kitasatospora sp. NPDC002040]|uniref:mevalonate kinase n=1 Tax=Kitasatospora sp. NPDC002040 TaxID=3154661 RepID=UPI003322A57A